MRNAVGIVRVSETKGREGDSFASPTEQRQRIEQACDRDGLQLLDVIQELDVSGGKPLSKREGLRRAVEQVEQGKASVIVAAYFDRLVRSLRVQDELVSRVEAAGGKVLALDTGPVTNGSAGQWLSSTMIGAVAEDQRRTTAERSRDAQRRAVARGVPTQPWIPPGYRKRPDGRLEPSAQAPVVLAAYRLRAQGATVQAVRDHLRQHGIKLSYHAACELLANRLYLGELHFGDLVNLQAHAPVVDAETFAAVQRTRVTKGRKAKSQRLLARLGVLVCAGCGSRMSVTSSHGRYCYRCSLPASDCSQRANISADLVERVVIEHVKAALEGIEGRAAAEENAAAAERDLAHVQEQLDALIAILDPLEPASRKRLQAATAKRDEARERLERLGGTNTSLTVTAAGDWDRLTLAERRALVRAVVDRVEIRPGRGEGRIGVVLQ